MNIPLNPVYLNAANPIDQVPIISKVIVVLRRKNQDHFGFDAREFDAEIVIPVSDSVESTLAKLRQALDLHEESDLNNFDPVILITGSSQNWSKRTVNVDPTIDAILTSVEQSLAHADNQAGLNKVAPAP